MEPASRHLGCPMLFRQLAQRKRDQHRTSLKNLSVDSEGMTIMVLLHKAPSLWNIGLPVPRVPQETSPLGQLTPAFRSPGQPRSAQLQNTQSHGIHRSPTHRSRAVKTTATSRKYTGKIVGSSQEATSVQFSLR